MCRMLSRATFPVTTCPKRIPAQLRILTPHSRNYSLSYSVTIKGRDRTHGAYPLMKNANSLVLVLFCAAAVPVVTIDTVPIGNPGISPGYSIPRGGHWLGQPVFPNRQDRSK